MNGLANVAYRGPWKGPSQQVGGLRGLRQTPEVLSRGEAFGYGTYALGLSALTGAGIGGVAAESWYGAGTGAIFGGTLSAMGWSIETAMANRPWLAVTFGALAVGGGFWTYTR